MLKLRKVRMDVCHGVVMFFTDRSIDESRYKWEYWIQFVEVFSFSLVSNLIVSIDPVQIRWNVFFRKVDVYGFTIPADGRKEEVLSSE